MKSLSINLTQDYKSFKNGFVVELRGNLIILSGVNGSGKSQLIDIIAQRESHGNKKAISATVKLDAGQISRNDVLRRTFKENVNVPELTHAGTETITSHKNNAWNAYNNYFLNQNGTANITSGAVYSKIRIPGYLNGTAGTNADLNYTIWFGEQEVMIKADLYVKFNQAVNDPLSLFNNFFPALASVNLSFISKPTAFDAS